MVRMAVIVTLLAPSTVKTTHVAFSVDHGFSVSLDGRGLYCNKKDDSYLIK